MSTPRLPRAPRIVQSRAVQYLDLDAIYAAVLAVQDGIVKKIASRCGRKEATFYQQQQREKGDADAHRRPYLVFQILKQQAALETKPREEACAELLCEADHLGADVVWRERSSGERAEVVTRLGAMLGEAADVVASTRTAVADNVLTGAELLEAKRQCRELRLAANLLEHELEAMVVRDAMDAEVARLYAGRGNGSGE